MALEKSRSSLCRIFVSKEMEAGKENWAKNVDNAHVRKQRLMEADTDGSGQATGTGASPFFHEPSLL